MARWLPLLCVTGVVLTGCSTPRQVPGSWPRHKLSARQTTLLNHPNHERFDASGLQLLPTGELLTMRNNGDALLYRVAFRPDGKEAALVPFNTCFNQDQLRLLDPGGFDCEGIARDEQGRFYLCEERHRWILRCDPKASRTERLPIDWSRVEEFFSKVDGNASFEGVAVGNGKLYVANERMAPVIIVVDLSTMRVKKHFEVYPTKSSFFGTHYSDLCWFEGRLWVLCRQHRVVLEVDPDSERILAEFDYSDIEHNLGYRTGLPVGIMEGLAVDRNSIWLVTDNNGDDRTSAHGDNRPTLVRCTRPDKK